MSDLTQKHCKPCEGGVAPLAPDEATAQMQSLHPQWQLAKDGRSIQREVRFGNYYETMAFVNAVAWIAHREDHHPDLEVGYNLCRVRYSTHAIDGLSENDLICAAKVDALLDIPRA
ncbi:MAG TPA: 4a-hydroxytetrahydrobiopterin dehydratase [Thioalkalivibrio sp.]|nr:4a-hydroxytetrahydrobiopterin dehydratase [Thioalkalivibrio sp.]